MKGIIALDIDGTITVDHHIIPSNVVKYLTELHSQDWRFIFITGRTFSWGYAALQFLPFSFYFAVQNGALLLEMPARRIITKKYLTKDIIPTMESICASEPTDFVIFAGFEMHDICYYRSPHFSPSLLDYLKSRVNRLEETWKNIDSFKNLNFTSFPSVKCFGEEKSAQRIANEIEDKLGLHAPLCRDPFNKKYFVVQATHPEINKGKALLDYLSHVNFIGPVIAAGDDMNDISMLQAVEHRIVMATAPSEVKALATIIAPSAADEGIINGLQQSIARIY
jgi:Cof subfamily protein (haloacid dehalogenase superfamily)